ncbi:hypothetical protein ACWDA7_47540 [Streptomyces sp. NPDC001156]
MGVSRAWWAGFGTVQQLTLVLDVAAAGAVHAPIAACHGVQPAFVMTLALDGVCTLALIVLTSARGACTGRGSDERGRFAAAGSAVE